jgi:hypothetical protein
VNRPAPTAPKVRHSEESPRECGAKDRKIKPPKEVQATSPRPARPRPQAIMIGPRKRGKRYIHPIRPHSEATKASNSDHRAGRRNVWLRLPGRGLVERGQVANRGTAGGDGFDAELLGGESPEQCDRLADRADDAIVVTAERPALDQYLSLRYRPVPGPDISTTRIGGTSGDPAAA